MKTYRYLFIIISFAFLINVQAQEKKVKPDSVIKELINKGLKAYDKADYTTAEIQFRQALSKEPLNAEAAYDLGLTETELDKNLEAARYFNKAAKQSQDPLLKAKSYFNEGDIWYQKKKYEKAVEAFKNALRNNPNDEEARYNLALAQQKLKQQQKKNKNKKNKQNKKNQQQNKNQNNKENQKKDQQKQNKQGNKDQKNKDKQGQNKNKQNNKNQKDQNKKGKGDKKKDQKGKPKDDQKNKNNQNKNGQQKDQQNKQGGKERQQPQQGQGQKRKAQLTPQQVKQLLVALKNKENKTQKKVKAKILKGRGKKQKQDKDW